MVANNMAALFITGAVVGVVAVVLARRAGEPTRLSTIDTLGLALSLAVLGGGIVWFFVDRDTFIAHGHDASAIPMFLAIIGVVWLNARDVQTAVRQGAVPTERSRYVAMYRTIALAMLVALAATVAINLATALDHARALGRGRAHHAVRRVLGRPDHRALEPRAAQAHRELTPFDAPIVGAWPATSTCTRSTRSRGPSRRPWPCCATAGLIAYPTDSGYALGAMVGNQSGKDRIREIRRLDDRHHYTLVCRDFAQLGQLVHVDNSVFRAVKASTPGSVHLHPAGDPRGPPPAAAPEEAHRRGAHSRPPGRARPARRARRAAAVLDAHAAGGGASR